MFGLLREENNWEMCHFKFATLQPLIYTAGDNYCLACHLKDILSTYRNNIDYANFSNSCREIHIGFALETGTKKLGSSKLL